LAEAGMSFDGPDQVVTSTEKVKLLGFLRRSHGKGDQATTAAAAPKKITLSRRKVQELTVGGGRTRSTVAVEVRQKRTYVKPEEGESQAIPAGTDPERAEILRKLEESRQRNLEEQQKLAEIDRKRDEEELAAQRRAAEEDAARRRAEAEAVEAAELAAREEKAAAKPGHHGHPKPPPAREEPRGHKHGQKHNRGSHVMVAGVEDDENAARFAGQLHLSASERARRTTARGRARPRRQAEQARSGTGFTRPTAPGVRDGAIGETITVADLAQKMALKGSEVVKALFKMGVMATITQTIDHDTAALVTEELGHNPVRADAEDAETELLAHVDQPQGDTTPRPP